MSEELETLAAEVLSIEPTKSKKPALELNTFISTEQLQKDLAITPNNLTECYTNHAALYAWYSEQYRAAQFQADRLDNQEKLVYAKIEMDVRKNAVVEGEKLTEASVKSRVLLDPRYQKIATLKLESEMIAGLTRDATEAFKQRRDMLIQLGSDAREEVRGGLRMREDSLDERKRQAQEIIEKSRSFS